MKTSDVLEAVEKFAEFDERRHVSQHKACGLHKVRVGGHMATRGDLRALLKAEIVKLKFEGR